MTCPVTGRQVDDRHTKGYCVVMKYFDWNDGKNELLKKERNVSFEEVILALEKNQLLAILAHPNGQKYPSQHIYIVEIENYAWIVPFVETEETIFLKTIIPSRKMTKIYLTGEKNGEDQTR